MRIIRKTLSLLIILSMAISMVSCAGSKTTKSKKKHKDSSTYPFLDKLDLSDWEAEAKATKESVLLTVINANECIYYHNDDFMKGVLGDNEAYNIIADTIKSEINEDNLTITATDASVDVIFTLADYKTVIKDKKNLKDSSTFYDAINAADIMSIPVTYQLAKNESGEWEINNLDEIVKAVTPYIGEEINFAPAAAKVSNGKYVAKIDYTSYFNVMVESQLGKSCDLNGTLYIYLYLTIDGDNATICLDESRLRKDIEAYVTDNENAIVKASTGVSISTAKVVTGMSYEEIHKMVMDTVMGEMNKINFKIFSKSGSFQVEADTIIITDSVSQKKITGKVSGKTITIDLTDNTEINQFIDVDIFTFTLQ